MPCRARRPWRVHNHKSMEKLKTCRYGTDRLSESLSARVGEQMPASFTQRGLCESECVRLRFWILCTIVNMFGGLASIDVRLYLDTTNLRYGHHHNGTTAPSIRLLSRTWMVPANQQTKRRCVHGLHTFLDFVVS